MEDDIIICPYDSNHRIKACKFSYHIIKCEKNSKKVLSVCSYNTIHRMDKELIREHEEECKDNPKNKKKKNFYEPLDNRERRRDRPVYNESVPKLHPDEYWD